MKNKRILSFVFAAVIMLALASGVSAQSFAPYQEQINSPTSPNQPESILSVTAQVSEAISYQGVLEETGTPVTGSRDMTFRLYSDDGCTTLATGIVDISDVPIDNGHFSVQLDFDPSVFTGQALFLEVQVESTAIACQEILAVPYALSLRPEAIIATDSTADEAAALIGEVSSTAPGDYSAGLRGINNGTGDNGIGVYGSHEGDGLGVLGSALGNGKGVYGSANGADGYGVYGSHRATTGTTPGVYGETVSQDAYANGVEGVVASTSPGSWSAGVAGINNGTGGSGIGVYGSQAGDGWGVYGKVDGDGRGVYGYADSADGVGVYGGADGADGVGVYATGSGSTGTALMLSNGGIRVNAAGLGTNTPVFIHQATASNITCGFSQCTEIDHPLTNSDPNAILFVTQNFNPDTITSTVNNPHPVGVQYLSTPSRWVIYNVDLAAMTDGAVFNVLVVKP